MDLAVKGPGRAVAEYRETGSVGNEDAERHGDEIQTQPYNDSLECMPGF